MNKNKMTIVDTGAYRGWVEAFVKTVLEKAGLNFKLVDIYEMDEERIYLRAESWDEHENNITDNKDDDVDYDYERELTIRYEDNEMDPWPNIPVEYSLYDTTHGYAEDIDCGEYKIICHRGKPKPILISDSSFI